TLFDFTDPNLFKISPEVISQFVREGIVPTNKVWKKKHKKNTSTKTPQEENELEIPKRNTVKIPANFRGRYKSNKTVSKLINELEIKNNFEFENIDNNELLWESGPLKERDLNIPKGDNTNPTGSMLFKKGTLKDINTRHYFRDEVFRTLDWSFDTRKNRTHIERAIANFKIVISGIDYGTFPLSISHNTNSKHLEKVKQPATQLHWGEAKVLIAQDELTGKTATLYKNVSVADAFTLIIE
ncbi:MAG TPA: hypothetical protein VFM82_09930, partial [Flavobacteriaceae bacterium]|nr:hypothetical protein [Flavobacteriaceae bacterium]